MKNMFRALLLSVCAVFAVLTPAKAQADKAIIVPTCGTAPYTYTAGQVQPIVQDVNGNICSSLSAAAGGGATSLSTIIPNNTTAVVVKASPGQVYGVECFNNSTTISYLKIYDAVSATAGSGTPKMRQMCPASSSGAGYVISYPTGRVFATGITFIMTTDIGDSGTTAPAANTYIVNVHYK